MLLLFDAPIFSYKFSEIFPGFAHGFAHGFARDAQGLHKGCTKGRISTKFHGGADTPPRIYTLLRLSSTTLLTTLRVCVILLG